MLRMTTNAYRSPRAQRDGGYLLLAILLMLAFMAITLAYVVAPRMVQQMKRDREEEMINRGTQYMRAIKKYYQKNGAYPNSLDDLDKGQIRYLRKRYKDPLTKDGKWKLLYYNDIAMLMNGAAPGTPAAALGAQGGMTPGGAIAPGGSAPMQGALGGAVQQQQQLQPGAVAGFSINSPQGYSPQGGAPGSVGGFATDSGQGSSPQSTPGSVGGFSAGSDQGNSSNGSSNSSNPSGSSQPGSSPFAQSGPGSNLPGGGGPIVGVASNSKDPTIRIYNKKTKYDEWQFIYNPMMDTGTVLLRGPYQPTTIGSAQIGTPASQMNGQQPNGQQQNGFGQQSPFGQQPGGFSQPQSAPQQMMQPSSSSPSQQNQFP
jgi:type II secretory pathway pseudopilin PulG